MNRVSVWMWRASIGLVLFGGIASLVLFLDGLSWYFRLSTTSGTYYQQTAAQPLRVFGIVGVVVCVAGLVALRLWGREWLQLGLAIAVATFVLTIATLIAGGLLYGHARHPWPKYQSELSSFRANAGWQLVGTFDGGGDESNPPASARVWNAPSTPSDTCDVVQSGLGNWLDSGTLHVVQLATPDRNQFACQFTGLKDGKSVQVFVGLTLSDVASSISPSGPTIPTGSAGPAIGLEIFG